MLCVRCQHPLPAGADRCLRCFALNPRNRAAAQKSVPAPSRVAESIASDPPPPLRASIESDPPGSPPSSEGAFSLLPPTTPPQAAPSPLRPAPVEELGEVELGNLEVSAPHP